MIICSDTNIWIDFEVIDGLDLPFRLGHGFCMAKVAIEDELLSPTKTTENLVKMGLIACEVTEEELYFTYGLMKKYVRLSRYDALALSIAFNRDLVLLTGDKALRNAAKDLAVHVVGTLWVFDELIIQPSF